ncbi:astacin-like metalloendopeptidase isoform X1 [Alosa sapidissima]|uniref:astacin-like metalloendopeptidase isoform X1 n=1 Tax=Alosa sapidissima TaxID=34773 RepID=UPI001C098A2D|nr:astacin-like metalloendopeptidase isoform X1 [Alosa sapidissima]
MGLRKIKLIFLTLVVFYCLTILLDHNTVVCAPVTGAFDDHGGHSTVKLNQQLDGLRPTSHNRNEWAFGLTKISPETINGIMGSPDFITEGDMFIESDRNAVDVRWPGEDGNVTVPYVIAPDFASKTADIQEAMNMISNKSCVTFHQRKNEDHYLSFKSHQGCASHVGFIGGEQGVYVGPYCSVGNICHELLHSLGFYHEHSRVDRDDHIQINVKNMIKGKEKNFKKVAGNTLGLPYDLGSILHYGRLFFSSNGKATVIPKKVNEEIGQRTRLSELDVQRLNKLYKCDHD